MGIYRLPDNRWRVQIRRKRIRVSEICATEAEARQAEARHLRGVSSRSNALTINNAWSVYQKSPDYLQKRERTRKTESGRIARWQDKFGQTPIDEIQPDDIEGYISSRLEADPQPGPDTVRLEVAAFSALMKFCVRKKWISANPCIGVPRPAGRRRIARMTAEEHGKLLALLYHPNRRFRYVARLCLLVLATGARPGEWIATRSTDIDHGKHRVVFKETKYKAQPRTVPLSPSAMELVDAQLADVKSDAGLQQAQAGGDLLLFPTIGKGNKVVPLQYTGALRDAKKKGLLPQSVRGHLGRHELISTLVESSELDDSRIMALVGHHSPASMEVYKHVRNTKFLPEIKRIDLDIGRQQRAEALAALLDIPVDLINMMLELRRAKAALDGVDDNGNELLFKADVLHDFQELSDDVAKSTDNRARIEDFLAAMRADMDRAKALRDEKRRPATRGDLQSIIAAISKRLALDGVAKDVSPTPRETKRGAKLKGRVARKKPT